MTRRTLIGRSLRFHWRAHFGVFLGAIIGSAAMTGALLVGDSVRESLRDRALARLGKIFFAMSTADRLFPSSLPTRLGNEMPAALTIPDNRLMYHFPISSVSSAALLLAGTAVREDGAARANQVVVLGVDARWPTLARWKYSQPPDPLSYSPPDLESALAATKNAALPEALLQRWRAGEIAFVNAAFARKLNVRENDEVVLRIEKPGTLAKDAVIAPRANSLALRLKIGAVIGAELLGDFSLSANQLPIANVFLPLDVLGAQTKLDKKANLLVTAAFAGSTRYQGWGQHLKTEIWRQSALFRRWQAPRAGWDFLPLPTAEALPWLQEELRRNWNLADAQLRMHTNDLSPAFMGGEPLPAFIEVTSPRIFLDNNVVEAGRHPRTVLITNRADLASDSAPDLALSQRLVTNAVGVLTYLANLIQAGNHATPYSMVSALGASELPEGMADDEILINEWLADDLKAKGGDSLQLSYYVADSVRRLIERTNSFRVRSIVPLKGLYADRTLMPEFPGIAEAESTHDWDAGFPLIYKIRENDEAYWKQFRGTPKAFITLAAGQKMWSNRFGSLTAIRYEAPTNTSLSACREAIERNLLANLKPEDFGLRFEPVREQALKAADQSQDFGQLFLGFSIFVVVAAMLLTALLFQFGLEQRAAEIGTLLALGFSSKQVRHLFLLEGLTLATLGSIFGATAGLAYAKAMLWGLTTVWRSAIANSSLEFHASLSSVAIGIAASIFVAALTLWFTLRKQARQPAYALLAGETAPSAPNRKPFQSFRDPSKRGRSPARSLGAWTAIACGLAAIALVTWALVAGETANAGIFFGAGALLLLSGLGLISYWLHLIARSSGTNLATPPTLTTLAVRACGRRRTRSLATAALLACGSFVIVAIGVFRLEATRDAARRDSGTGGFALIGQTTLPVVQDLNTKAGREFFGLSEEDLRGVTVIPLRVREGDEASCLNLNRARKPRLLGVNPELLQDRFTFTKLAEGTHQSNGWDVLRKESGESREERGTLQTHLASLPSPLSSSIPAVGDANSIQWALGKKVGQTLDYADEHGQPFKIRLAVAVANSILQGNLIIDEAEFVKKFPSESGYRMFLLDCPSNEVKGVSATLSRALQDVGLELTPTVERLESFNAVQNTYLGTFQVLGGLGLLLGSAGLGIVVLRNVLERRGELGLLVAVGFRRSALQRLVLGEHAALLALGLALGTFAAAVAVLPALLSPATHLPYGSLTLTLAAVLCNGALWTWLATKYTLRGNLSEALRNE